MKCRPKQILGPDYDEVVWSGGMRCRSGCGPETPVCGTADMRRKFSYIIGIFTKRAKKLTHRKGESECIHHNRNDNVYIERRREQQTKMIATRALASVDTHTLKQDHLAVKTHAVSQLSLVAQAVDEEICGRAIEP